MQNVEAKKCKILIFETTDCQINFQYIFNVHVQHNTSIRRNGSFTKILKRGIFRELIGGYEKFL